MDLPDRLTVSDFLTWLARQPDDAKYELLDGKVQRRETGTNVLGELIERLSEFFTPVVRARGCRKYSGSLSVICANGDVPVPDIVVTCDERDRPEPGKRGIRYPRLVVEVLSPSNDALTLRQKEDAYCGTPSVEEYLMVDSTRRWAQVWRRNAEGDFVRHPAFGGFHVATLGLTIDLEEVYADVIEA